MKGIGFILIAIFLLLAGCAHQKTAALPESPKLAILNQQIKANPQNSQAYSNRGYVLALLGQKEAARADIQKSISLKDNANTHNRAGWAYFNMGDHAAAAREFEKGAQQSDFKAHYDYYSLVLGYWGTGDIPKAVENYQKAVERDPKFGEFKALNDRTAEWTALERRAIHEIYVLWSKTWRP